MPFKKKTDETEEMQNTEENVPETETPQAGPETAEEPAAEVSETDELKTALKAAEDKRDEYLLMAQRVQADFENYKRRNKAVRAEAFEDGAREFITQLLPVVDNLERALDQPTADDALQTGVKMVYRQMMEVLKKRGVTEIECLGEKFDPNWESAVMQGTSDEGAPGTVCAVLQKGYKLGETVIRHAMVKVVAE